MDNKQIRLKRIVNILFYINIFLVTFLVLIGNKDFSILKTRYVVNDQKTLQKYREYKYISLDLSNSKETRFSISDNDNKISTIYLVSFDDETLLVELSNGSIITDKVNVLLKKDTAFSTSLKEDIITESEEKLSFKPGYYTNINLKENEKIVQIKMIISYILIFISITLAAYNLLTLFYTRNRD